ncbi:MAG: hypothetical protein HON90_13440 [Halobacteriovoraceae bacterium]|nr:hypothetical protein [Halobacteriovoraceae bacterium]
MKQKLEAAKTSLSDLDLQLSKNLNDLLVQLYSEKFSHGFKLGVYMPMKFEPKWMSSNRSNFVTEHLLVHMHEEVHLTYHAVEFEKILTNDYGQKLELDVLKDIRVPDVILIPGLAYTRSGERLGRGRAYFDSFLKDFKGVKIGVFYSLQEVENVYREKHDVSLDYIVTEKEIIRGK